MRARLCFLIIILSLVTGCMGTHTPTTTVTSMHANKQPIQPGVLISGQLSGLPDNVNAAISVYLPSLPNRPVVWAKRGNGNWELSVSANYDTYRVMADIVGYVVAPISYTIHLDDGRFFVVENGQVTNNEVTHLDFSFVSEP